MLKNKKTQLATSASTEGPRPIIIQTSSFPFLGFSFVSVDALNGHI